MWVGRGFDTDGDGDNDIFVVQKLTAAQQKENAQTLGCMILIGLAVAGCMAIYYAIMAAVAFWTDWWQTNSSFLISWAGFLSFWAMAIAVVIIALGVLIIGVLGGSAQAKPLHAIPNVGQSGAKHSSPPKDCSKPCKRCGKLVLESHLSCPNCRLSYPHPSEATVSTAKDLRLFSPTFCVFACGVLAAVDGRLTNEEAGIVVHNLRGLGVSEEQLRGRLLDACRKIHSAGVERTLERLSGIRQSSQCFALDKGLSAEQLIDALKELGEKCGGESPQKQAIRDRLVVVIQSDS